MSAIAKFLRAAGLRVALALVAACGPGAAFAQSYFDPWQAPNIMVFRPGSFDELLFVTNTDVGANLVLARHMPDGRLVARTEVKGPFDAAAFLGRDRILTGDRHGVVAVWSLEGKRLATLIGGGPPIASLAASPSGRFIGLRHPKGPIRVLTAAGRQLAAIGLGPGGIECEDEFGTGKIVFTPDERMLVSADKCGKLIAATIDGRPVPIDERDSIFVAGIALARDGRTLLLSYFGMPGGGADFRTLSPGRISARRKAPGPFGHADPQAIAALGDRFVVASRDRLRFMGADGQQVADDATIENPQRLAASDNGERLAVYAKEGVVLFGSGGRRANRRPFADFGVPVQAALLSDVMVTLSAGGSLRFWRSDGTLLRRPVVAWRNEEVEHADFARPRLLLAPGRKLLAVVTPVNTVQLFDAEGAPRGPPIALPAQQYHGIETKAVALLDDRVVVPASDGRSLRVLGLDGAERAAGLAPHPYGIRALAFAADGSRFVTLDERGILRLWSGDGTLVKQQRAIHGTSWGAPMFAPQGGFVAVAGGTKTMLWHFDAPGRVEQRPGVFVRFLPDGALVRVEGNELVIDEPDGPERYVKSFREPVVYAVSDDARWALVSERGVARKVALDKSQ